MNIENIINEVKISKKKIYQIAHLIVSYYYQSQLIKIEIYYFKSKRNLIKTIR